MPKNWGQWFTASSRSSSPRWLLSDALSLVKLVLINRSQPLKPPQLSFLWRQLLFCISDDTGKREYEKTLENAALGAGSAGAADWFNRSSGSGKRSPSKQ